MSSATHKNYNNTNNNRNQREATTTPPTRTRYCTAALPGLVFQEIYTCRVCCSSAGKQQPQQQHACICAACADLCHASCRRQQTPRIISEDDNDDDDEEGEEEEAVEYIGVGPASCDCHGLTSCQCNAASAAYAKTLLATNNGSASWDASCTLPATPLSSSFTPVQVYDIPILQKYAPVIVAQAQLLVQHSKETFWIDNNSNRLFATDEECLLQRLARDILEYHTQNDGIAYLGAEWWVQVKQQQHPSLSSSSNDKTATAAIDMHYDKDEVLAESFGLGVFPTRSTVTYLTTTTTSMAANNDTDAEATSAAPTLVFPRTYHNNYDSGDDGFLTHVYVSRPVVGKHFVFDGSLLHGAIPLLDSKMATVSSLSSSSSQTDKSLRVTFLVNLWNKHRPMGIQPLSCTIRQVLLDQATANDDSFASHISFSIQQRPADAIPTILAPLSVANNDDARWQSLPFVENGMVVKTVNLSHIVQNMVEEDVIKVEYKQGLQAYLDYPDDDDEEDDEDENTDDGKDEGD